MKIKLPKRKLNRLKSFDYSTKGAYFITICTQDKKCLLSNIVGEPIGLPQIELTKYGKIFEHAINNIKQKYNSLARVERYVIMPNHIHLIIRINGSPMGSPTIQQIINQLKGWITRQIGKAIFQKSFYDRIIRNDEEYLSICKYIDENPQNWQTDSYYKK